MDYCQEDEAPFQTKLTRYVEINPQFEEDGGFWDVRGCHEDENEAQPKLDEVSKFTSSIFLAAPPPSVTMKMMRLSNNPSVDPTLSSRPSPDSFWSTHTTNAPVKSVTSSFYTTTQAFPLEKSARVIPLSRASSNRQRYHSTSSGSTSSTDSGIVSFDISLPSQSDLVIDSLNASPENSGHKISPRNPSEMFYQDQENGSELDAPAHTCTTNSNTYSSTFQFSNLQKPLSKSVKMLNTSNRRASFEIHASQSDDSVGRTFLDIPGYRHHSLHTDQSAGPPDTDINNNKYKGFDEDVLVDLLKKCTDFPERRRIRAALRYVRENQKVSDNNITECSTVTMVTVPVGNPLESAPTSVSVTTLRLAAFETDPGQIIPVFTSTPRDVSNSAPDENFNSLKSTDLIHPEEQQECFQSKYHFEIPRVRSETKGINLVVEGFPDAKKVPGSDDKTEPKDRTGKNVVSSVTRKVSSARSDTRTTAKAIPHSTQPERVRVKSAPLRSSTTSVNTASSSAKAKASVKVNLSQPKPQQSVSSNPPGNRAKSAGTVRERSQVSKTATTTKGSDLSVKKISGTGTATQSVRGSAKTLTDERKASVRATSPRRKLPSVRPSSAHAAINSTVKSSASSSEKQSLLNTKAKHQAPTSKVVQKRTKTKNTISTGKGATSDSVVVVGASGNIIIPKIVISDESETEHEVSGKTLSRIVPKQEVHPTQLQDKQNYYRRKQRPVVSPIPEGDDQKMAAAVTMETASSVMKGTSNPVNVEAIKHNESSRSGDDLEKAFTDLLDNFDKLSENEETHKDTEHSDVKRVNEARTGEILSCSGSVRKDTESSNRGVTSAATDDNPVLNKKPNEDTTDSQCRQEASALSDQFETASAAEVSPAMKSSPLAAVEAGIDVNRLGDVTIEESDDGALTVTDVQQSEKGQRKVSVTTKKQRTGSDGEYQDKETKVVRTFESPSGTKYEEQDIVKTRRKLTHTGSIYLKKDTVRTKRAFSKTGEQTVEEDHIVETDNKSVSQGKSWGGKTLTTMVLNKPTKSDRSITAIQEEITAEKSSDGTLSDSSAEESIPDIVQALADQKVRAGCSVTLQCQGTALPAPTVTWYAGATEVTETAYFKPSFDGKTAQMTITEVFQDDQQVYRCVFKNCHGSAETSCNLTVTGAKQEAVPSITSALEDTEASPGGPVTLQCGVKGLGEVFWFKEGTRLSVSRKYDVRLNSGTAVLCIKNVTIEDSGQYSCSVKNSAGEASTICQLTVSVEGCPPDIINPLFNCSATSGKPFKLLCRISGDPEPTVTWYHKGRELRETAKCKPSYVDNIARLELKPVTQSDGGVYECMGKNPLGSASTSCELTVQAGSSATKASMQLNIKPVSKSLEKEDDHVDVVRRLEASQSLDIPSSTSTSQQSQAKDSDIYCSGQVRSCTPPPQAVSCPPPPSEVLVRSCSPPRGRGPNASLPSPSPSQNGRYSSTTNGQTDSTKTSAVNRLSNFFGNIMNDSSSSPNNSFSRSPSQDVQVETKSSFVVKKRENGSFKSDRNSTELLPNKGETGVSRSQPAVSDSGFDLSSIHRDIIMSAKIQEIEDDEELHKMLNTTDNFEDRKMIRARLKELREKAREEWERGRKEREAASVDVVKLRQQRAEEDKKKKMQTFQTRAETAGKDLEDKYLVQTQKDLKEKHRFAEDEKQKKLDAYKQIAKTGSGVSESKVTTSKQSTTDKDGKTTTTTTKTVTVQQSAGFGGTQYGAPAPRADDVANNLANKLQQDSSPYTSGKITVRTESWNSQEGVVKKSETTQRWGANKPAGPKGAMAAFKQMDSLNPGAAKPNALVTVALAKKAATTMRRNAVQIKAEILDFCKSNTAEYENVQVTNFSSCWNNGMAFCALIHHFYPDSFDFSTLDPKQRRKNFELAFDTAEKCADIAPLLDVEDMVKMKNPDWKCVFTYVQSFYRHLRNHPNCKQIVPPSQ